MKTPLTLVGWYDACVRDLVAAYEAVDPDRLHAWLVDLLPAETGLVLDVGAGSGRDAAWFARRGHSVVAVEPAAAMRAEARARHPEAAISCIDDTLPALNQVHRQGHAFHVILLSGVWQYVLPAERPQALRKLLGLLRVGGMLALSLRYGPAEAARGMHLVSLDEVERLVRAHGAIVERIVDLPDQLGRSGVSWKGVVLRLPDDGTGALPLLRHIILNEGSPHRLLKTARQEPCTNGLPFKQVLKEGFATAIVRFSGVTVYHPQTSVCESPGFAGLAA